jgi:hypothetical protein
METLEKIDHRWTNSAGFTHSHTYSEYICLWIHVLFDIAFLRSVLRYNSDNSDHRSLCFFIFLAWPLGWSVDVTALEIFGCTMRNKYKWNSTQRSKQIGWCLEVGRPHWNFKACFFYKLWKNSRCCYFWMIIFTQLWNYIVMLYENLLFRIIKKWKNS